MTILADLGEFRILGEVVLPELAEVAIPDGLGDDVAVVRLRRLRDADVIVTTDSVPRPLVFSLGGVDWRTWGWYSVAINGSDIAAAGGDPLVFLCSVEASPEMAVADLREFFRGISDACKAFGFMNAGGNLKSGKEFSCHGTVLGAAPSGHAIKRSGCKPGDLIISIGRCGVFSSAFVLARIYGLSSLDSDLRGVLERPFPKLSEMSALRLSNLVHAASDGSDGVLGAAINIAEASGCGIEFDMASDKIPPFVRDAAKEKGLYPWNLMFSWGDWQVICAVDRNRLTELDREAKRLCFDYVVLGRAIEGGPALYGISDGHRRKLNLLRNEGFTTRSYAQDPEGHMQMILCSPLFEDGQNSRLYLGRYKKLNCWP